MLDVTIPLEFGKQKEQSLEEKADALSNSTAFLEPRCTSDCGEEMKSVFVIVLFIAGQVFAQPAPKPIDPVSAFQSIVSEAGAQKSATFVGLNGRKKWIKQFFQVGEIRYDVKKTDSLVDPIVGIVSFPVDVKVAGQFETKEDAEAAPQPSMPGGSKYMATGTYYIRDGAWRLTEFKYTETDRSDPLYGILFKASAEEIKQGSKTDLLPVLRNWVR